MVTVGNLWLIGCWDPVRWSGGTLSRFMPSYAYGFLITGWLIWVPPFLLAVRSAAPARDVDRRARSGISLVAVAYSILWQAKFWEKPLPSPPSYLHIHAPHSTRHRVHDHTLVVALGLPRVLHGGYRDSRAGRRSATGIAFRSPIPGIQA